MEEKQEVIDISNKNFRDELAVLSNICEKLNTIYQNSGQIQGDNTDTEDVETVLGETDENVLKLNKLNT